MTTMYRLGGSHLHFDIALCSTSIPATQMIPRADRIDLIHDHPQWIIKNQLERIARTTQACFEPATNGSRVGAANCVITMRCTRSRTCACFCLLADLSFRLGDRCRYHASNESNTKQNANFATQYSHGNPLVLCFVSTGSFHARRVLVLRSAGTHSPRQRH